MVCHYENLVGLVLLFFIEIMCYYTVINVIDFNKWQPFDFV